MEVSKCGSEAGQIFMAEKSIKMWKILGLITDTEDYQKIYNYAWRKHK